MLPSVLAKDPFLILSFLHLVKLCWTLQIILLPLWLLNSSNASSYLPLHKLVSSAFQTLQCSLLNYFPFVSSLVLQQQTVHRILVSYQRWTEEMCKKPHRCNSELTSPDGKFLVNFCTSELNSPKTPEPAHLHFLIVKHILPHFWPRLASVCPVTDTVWEVF